MSIESDLMKDGIQVISKLDTLVVNNIARNIARKIVATFPELNFDETNLLELICTLLLCQTVWQKQITFIKMLLFTLTIKFNLKT